MIKSVVILAGGVGQRLWPASTQKRPKQFIDPGSGTSLLQASVKRAALLEEKPLIVVVTHTEHVPGAVEQIAALGEDTSSRVVILPEPAGRNTAPAVAYATAYLEREGIADGNTLVLAADHIISPQDQFAADVRSAAEIASDGYLVVFGIKPTRPETGYGYIEAGDAHGPGYVVRSFREKPDLMVAEKYVKSGRYFWNSGMFVFHSTVYHEELAEYAPEIRTGFANFSAPFTFAERRGVRVAEIADELEEVYRRMPKISVDYAVMESSRRVAMVQAGFEWSDVGSWDELSKVVPNSDPSAASVTGEGPVFQAGSRNNYVHSELPVAICGLDNVMVVVENGMVLVCRKGSSQLVREIVTQIERSGHDELL